MDCRSVRHFQHNLIPSTFFTDADEVFKMKILQQKIYQLHINGQQRNIYLIFWVWYCYREKPWLKCADFRIEQVWGAYRVNIPVPCKTVEGNAFFRLIIQIFWAVYYDQRTNRETSHIIQLLFILFFKKKIHLNLFAHAFFYFLFFPLNCFICFLDGFVCWLSIQGGNFYCHYQFVFTRVPLFFLGI